MKKSNYARLSTQKEKGSHITAPFYGEDLQVNSFPLVSCFLCCKQELTVNLNYCYRHLRKMLEVLALAPEIKLKLIPEEQKGWGE